MQLPIRKKIELQFRLFAVCAKNGWSWSHIWKVTHSLFHGTDNVIVSLLLANASFMWAAFMLYNTYIFQYPPYQIMRAVAPVEVWTGAFLFHFVAVYWHMYDPVRRVIPGLLINGFGFILWFFATVSLNYYAGTLSPDTAAELTLCLASAWALYKTGFPR